MKNIKNIVFYIRGIEEGLIMENLKEKTMKLIKNNMVSLLNAEIDPLLPNCKRIFYQPDRQAVLNWQSEKNNNQE